MTLNTAPPPSERALEVHQCASMKPCRFRSRGARST